MSNAPSFRELPGPPPGVLPAAAWGADVAARPPAAGLLPPAGDFAFGAAATPGWLFPGGGFTPAGFCGAAAAAGGTLLPPGLPPPPVTSRTGLALKSPSSLSSSLSCAPPAASFAAAIGFCLYCFTISSTSSRLPPRRLPVTTLLTSMPSRSFSFCCAPAAPGFSTLSSAWRAPAQPSLRAHLLPPHRRDLCAARVRREPLLSQQVLHRPAPGTPPL